MSTIFGWGWNELNARNVGDSLTFISLFWRPLKSPGIYAKCCFSMKSKEFFGAESYEVINKNLNLIQISDRSRKQRLRHPSDFINNCSSRPAYSGLRRRVTTIESIISSKQACVALSLSWARLMGGISIAYFGWTIVFIKRGSSRFL